MNELTVALMCHNRPKTAVEAIKSILDQTLNNFDFIVSDNSTNNELQNILSKDFSKVESIVWDPHHKTLFEHFNAFFCRKLRPEARPVDPDSSVITFPADGRHLCVPDISRSKGLFVEGEMFDLESLLLDSDLAQRYKHGSLVLSRLCPVDYHRYHFPIGGRAGAMRLINGPLYSVNPIALRKNIHILAANKRAITILDTDNIGRVLLLEVGATCVGSICQTFQENSDVSKGDEKGYFRFGGSSTITIFEPGQVEFDEDLLANSAEHTELYGRVGDHMGRII